MTTQITPMTADEFAQSKSQYVRALNLDAITGMSEEQKGQAWQQVVSRVEKAQRKVEEADTYRPTYAPKDQMTREQQGSRAVLAEEIKFARFIATALGRTE